MIETIQNTGLGISEYDDDDVIRLLKEDITGGKNWYISILEAISRWTKTEETIEGRTYCYLIGGEAFDWLLLAERLCRPVELYIPENEELNLLFYGKAPVNLSNEEFRSVIGENKYRQYLNFFYGITVEQALFLSIQEDIRKERMTTVFRRSCDYEDEVYQRIYSTVKMLLLKQFRKGKKNSRSHSISIAEMKEFTYWLFKYRLEHSDRSRVASDTKKAMEFLKEQYVKSLKKVG